MTLKTLTTLAAGLLTLAGCRGETSPATTPDGEAGPIRIVCTVGMVADLVREVAGERAQVTNIIGEGVDPHLYKPTRGDITKLLDAEAVFYAGLLLEGKMTDALVRVGRGKPVFAVTESIDPAYLLEPEGFGGHADPHVWMDVAGWIRALDQIALSLAEIDPAHAAEYQTRAAAYRTQLEQLDQYARRSIASIPRTQRVLVTAHDAFNYFGRAYDIEVLGIQGISTESEAGLEDLNRLIDLIVSRDVRSVFVETSVADKNVQALAEGAAARGKAVEIGGSLFSDAMGPPGTYEGTYLGMIDHNVTTITRALGGDASPGGLHGKLAEDTMTTAPASRPPRIATGDEHPADAPLSIHDMTVAYDRRPVLWDIDFDAPPGQLIGIIGPNGAGKSTLIKASLDLVPKASGRVLVFGEPYRRQRQLVAYVPQRESVDWEFPASALDVVTMGLYGKIGWLRRVSRQHRRTALDALDHVGMADYAKRHISELSGGQQQRVFLARALAQDARLYLMDEPFAGVDAATEQAIVGLLRELRDRGRTVIVVHHDLQTVPAYFDHVLLLNMRIVAAGPTDVTFTPKNLERTYGGRLTLLEQAAEALAGRGEA